MYLIAIILALPTTWLVVGRSGEDVPGMIAMVVTIVFFGIYTLALGSLRRRLQNRRSAQKIPQTILGDATRIAAANRCAFRPCLRSPTA
jgi:hypothetical protein